MMQTVAVSGAEVASKNREIYDGASGPVWHLAVYGPVHDGWEFINLGGERIVRQAAELACIGRKSEVVEFCSGLGAVCRYLSQTFGCRTTGVEWNPIQADWARRKLQATSPSARELVEIVNGDCTTWQPPRAVDAVLSFDSMMLLPDVAKVHHNAWRCLKPGGRMVMVTIAGGNRIDQRTRDFAWDVDGMASLLSAEEHVAALRDTGFEQIHCSDETAWAVEMSERIEQALERNRGEIETLQGAEGYRGWVTVGRMYTEALRTGRLAYLLASAVKNT